VNGVSEETHGGTGSDGGSGQKPRKPKVVPLPQKREVSDKHLANLRASALSDETIGLAELYTEANHHALAAIVQRKVWNRMCGAALVIPFYLPDATEPHAYRVRPTTPRVEKRGSKRREVKYDQADAHGSLVYFTPRARAARWYADPARVLYWTEGEKKALVLDQLELVCVGLTGVWNWSDAQHRRDSGEERLHPMLREHVAIAGRRHIICFDADARDNEQVMLAAARLCGVLLAAGALSVKFVCPPTREQKGIDDYFATFGADVVLKLLESAGEIEPADPKSPLQRVRKLRALREAPVNDNLRVPEGYEVQKDGALWRTGDEKHGDSKVGRAVILLQRHLDDYYTHDGRVDICFNRDDRWVSLCVTRKAIADSRTMVAELAPYGAPVTSNSAAKLVDWLEDFERVNAGLIERVSCVGRAGWHAIDDERVFVADKPLFSDDERERPLALDTRGDRRKLFSALAPRGERDAHLAALRRAWQADPCAAAVICGALAATLLEPLGAPNFAIHLPGDSSRGKTSMLKIAASVFGDPHNDHWVASWNTTPVAAELRAAVLTDLPQCYDEVGSSDPAQIERMVYMLVNGGGKARGQRDLSLRETPSWRTVVLSTGERELADQSAATGAQIRVVQLPVVGFGRLTGAEIDELRESCAANAGSFGRYWLETLLGIEDWEPFRESLRTFTRNMRGQAKDALEGRTATYFAVLAVAEAIASQIGLGEAGGLTMQRLFRDQARRETVESLADRALGLVSDWEMSEAEAFPELEFGAAGEDRPPKGRSNLKLHGFRKPELRQTIFIPAQFRAFCAEHRLASREVLREWAQRGWLIHEPGRLDKDVRIGGNKQRFYVLEHPEEGV
jgi:hypothetical protein